MDKLLRVYSQNVDGFEEKAGLEYVNLESPTVGLASRHTPQTSQEDSTSDYEESRRYRPIRKRRRISRTLSNTTETDRWSTLPRAQKVVAAHGSNNDVVCAACGWKGDWDDRIQRKFEEGKKVACPRCETRCEQTYNLVRERHSYLTDETSNLQQTIDCPLREDHFLLRLWLSSDLLFSSTMIPPRFTLPISLPFRPSARTIFIKDSRNS